MLRNLMFGAAAVALVAFTNPAGAQVAPLPDVEIEGPIADVYVPAVTPYVETTTGEELIGEMKVMGTTIKVRANALIHTPGTASTNTETAIELLQGFSRSAPPLPGRSTGGFIGGTAIVIGESIGGTMYANDVFSDMFENVIVGEATGRVVVTGETVKQMSINNMAIMRSTDWRLTASAPINEFGLKIRPNSIVTGTLAAAEGYYSSDKSVLYYHTLAADNATLANTERTQVSIMRADCRVRGRGRDEIEVRGGTVNPADASVQIRIPVLNADGTPAVNANGQIRFSSIGSVQAVPDNTVTPPQGLYRADFDTLDLPGGVCPTLVRAVILAGPDAPNQATATAEFGSRAGL
jgi:hypothetical protein